MWCHKGQLPGVSWHYNEGIVPVVLEDQRTGVVALTESNNQNVKSSAFERDIGIDKMRVVFECIKLDDDLLHRAYAEHSLWG